jgi:hypothetical protein
MKILQQKPKLSPGNTNMKWQAIYKHRNGEWMILGTLMAFKVALQYVLIHPSFDLHRDEYLHLDQADHLAWGIFLYHLLLHGSHGSLKC